MRAAETSRAEDAVTLFVSLFETLAYKNGACKSRFIAIIELWSQEAGLLMR